jgi:hypothetical protein
VSDTTYTGLTGGPMPPRVMHFMMRKTKRGAPDGVRTAAKIALRVYLRLKIDNLP